MRSEDRNVFREVWKAITRHTEVVERQSAMLAVQEARAQQERRRELEREAEEWRRRREERATRREERATQREPERLPESRLMFTAAFAALRRVLVFVPDHHVERVEGGVRIACKCRRLLAMRDRTMFECRCGRLYVATRDSVKVVPLEETARVAA